MLGIVYYQQGNQDAAITECNASIEADNLEEAHNNLKMITSKSKTVEASELQISPICAPMGAPTVWCEIVD